jgi:hypothetical protein
MWITRDLSTAPSYPQNLPQVYPQILPLLSTGLSTSHIRKARYIDPIYGEMYVCIHNSGILSTIFVDKFRFPLTERGELSTGSWRSCGQPVNNIRRVCLGDVTKDSPCGRGVGGFGRVSLM